MVRKASYPRMPMGLINKKYRSGITAKVPLASTGRTSTGHAAPANNMAPPAVQPNDATTTKPAVVEEPSKGTTATASSKPPAPVTETTSNDKTAAAPSKGSESSTHESSKGTGIAVADNTASAVKGSVEDRSESPAQESSNGADVVEDCTQVEECSEEASTEVDERVFKTPRPRTCCSS